jgi:hypothetical protein
MSFEIFRQGFILNASLHFAKVHLLSIVWLKYMGFLTGMVLSFSGAFFIVGKILEPGSAAGALDVGNDSVKAGLKTAYPGLILAALGSALIAATIYVPRQIDWKSGDVTLPIFTPEQTAGVVEKVGEEARQRDLEQRRKKYEQPPLKQSDPGK